MTRELKEIGNNMSQIAFMANATGLVDEGCVLPRGITLAGHYPAHREGRHGGERHPVFRGGEIQNQGVGTLPGKRKIYMDNLLGDAVHRVAS